MEKHSLSELELMLKEYQKFFEETPVAFFRTSISDGSFLMANSYCAQLLGYDSVEELLEHGRSVDLYEADTRKKLIKLMRKQGSVQDFEIKLKIKGDKEIWVRAHVHINCGGTCIEGSLLDVTEEKRLELEVEDLRKNALKDLSQVSKHLDEVIGSYLSTSPEKTKSSRNSRSS